MRRFLLLGAALLTGCAAFNEACTLIGCASGLRVQLDGAPSVAYTIEVKVPGQATSQTFNCATPSQCVGGAFFADFVPQTVQVTITVGTSVRTLTVDPQYSTSRPNGPNCEPTCTQATITIPP